METGEGGVTAEINGDPDGSRSAIGVPAEGQGEVPSEKQHRQQLGEAEQVLHTAQEDALAEKMQTLALERQPSNAGSLSSEGEEGGSAGRGEAHLFAGQEDEQPPPAPEQQPAQPQQLAAAAAIAAGQQAGSVADVEQLSAWSKHVFVFSTAGKPIYSYRGDESRLASLMATAEAILSVAHSKGHTLKHIRAGQHVFAFLERPPLCLVGVSALGEPPAVLRMQLVLVHGQIVSLLTATALSAMFARNPGYDARKLLGGSEVMLSALIDSFLAAPATLLGAYPSLPLLGGVRQALTSALAAAVKATSAVHGLLVAGGAVAAASAAAAVAPMQQWDVLLLLNLLGANQSFRHSGEAMTPICLPRYNPAANLHAYIHYLHTPSQAAVVLLCGGLPDFAALSAARQRMQQQLESIGALQALVQCAEQEAGQHHGSRSSSSSGNIGSSRPWGTGGSKSGALLAVENLPAAAGGGPFGSTPLLHFIYKCTGRQQYVMSPFSPPLVAAGLQQALVVAYSQLRASVFEGSSGSSGPLQRLRYEARTPFVLLGSVSTDTELYLTFDPLTDEAEADGVRSRLSMWLSARHDQLFGA